MPKISYTDSRKCRKLNEFFEEEQEEKEDGKDNTKRKGD